MTCSWSEIMITLKFLSTIRFQRSHSLSGRESHLKVRKQSIPSAHREASFYFDQRRQLIGGSDLQYIKNHIFFSIMGAASCNHWVNCKLYLESRMPFDKQAFLSWKIEFSSCSKYIWILQTSLCCTKFFRNFGWYDYDYKGHKLGVTNCERKLAQVNCV